MKHASSRFLRHTFSGIHTDDSVVGRAQRFEKGPHQPDETVSAYIEELSTHRNPDVWKAYLGRYVVKSVSDNYLQNERRRLIELGHGGLVGIGEGTLTEEHQRLITESIQSDQKDRLHEWVDYFTENNAGYPDWFIYYVSRHIVGLAPYDKKTQKLPKRQTGTVANFPELDEEALSMVFEKIITVVGEDADDKDLKSLASIGFAKMYAEAITELSSQLVERDNGTEGVWVKYHQTHQSSLLSSSLKGKRTGWCTASAATARLQLKEGNLYIYYTYGSTRKADIPRIAIRTQFHHHNEQVVEVRGVEAGQALENEFIDIVVDKLQTLPGGSVYDKKVHDMKNLTRIHSLIESGEELDTDDLIFLYEIDSAILGFGQRRDPRIEWCIHARDKTADFKAIVDALGSTPITQEVLEKLPSGSFPKIVIVDGNFISSNLNCSYAQIHTIKATGAVRITSGSKLLQRPENISAGSDILIHNARWRTLPELRFYGSLFLRNIPIDSLPHGLSVNGSLHLSKTNITQLPDDLVVNGGLKWHTDYATPFALNGATINGSIDISDSSFTSLPDNLHVRGDLNISSSQITELPKGLIVDGRLDVTGCSIMSIPPDAQIGDWVYVGGTQALNGFDGGEHAVNSNGSAYNNLTLPNGALHHLFRKHQTIDLSTLSIPTGHVVESKSTLTLQNGNTSSNRFMAPQIITENILVPGGSKISAGGVIIRKRGEYRPRQDKDVRFSASKAGDYDIVTGRLIADSSSIKSILENASEIYVQGNADFSVPGYVPSRFPGVFIVDGSLNFASVDLSRIPKDSVVVVGKDLNIYLSNLSELPKNWRVGGDITTDIPMSKNSFSQISGEIYLKRH